MPSCNGRSPTAPTGCCSGCRTRWRAGRSLLGQGGFADVGEQRAASAPDDRLPYLLFVLDRWEGFSSSLGEVDNGRLEDDVQRLLREGASAGLHIVLAGDRSLLSGRMSTLVDRKARDAAARQAGLHAQRADPQAGARARARRPRAVGRLGHRGAGGGARRRRVGRRAERRRATGGGRGRRARPRPAACAAALPARCAAGTGRRRRRARRHRPVDAAAPVRAVRHRRRRARPARPRPGGLTGGHGVRPAAVGAHRRAALARPRRAAPGAAAAGGLPAPVRARDRGSATTRSSGSPAAWTPWSSGCVRCPRARWCWSTTPRRCARASSRPACRPWCGRRATRRGAWSSPG
nr:hypothetical protein [Angustibacter aerolatus]